MISSSCPLCKDRICEKYIEENKFKENDIVVIKEPPGNPTIPKETVTEIIHISSKTWSYYTSVREKTYGLICNKRFRYATKREAFLYYILGQHVLEEYK